MEYKIIQLVLTDVILLINSGKSYILFDDTPISDIYLIENL